MAQASPDDLLREGGARHARGELAMAERLYRRVLKLRPGDANALNLLSVAARQRGDLAAALSLSAQALSRMPQSPVFLASRGATLADAGQLDEAIAAFRAALVLRPADATTLRNLGQALCATGEAAAAIPILTQATRLAPGVAEPWLSLAHALREAGDTSGAIVATTRLLALPAVPPAIAEQARFLMAALGAAATPGRAPAPYVRDLFDQYATRFDADLEGKLGYQTPKLIAELLQSEGILANGERRVLDLGCGTGLSGVVLKPFARRLEGLDLSPRMLAQARQRGLYDALHEADLLEWLPHHRTSFDLIAAADVLNYLGDLAPAFSAIATALRPNGRAVFSLEVGEGQPFALGPGLRYRHDPAHVLALAGASGLMPEGQARAVLRHEQGAPVAGVLLLLASGRATI